MYPSGHARNTTANLESILSHKFQLLGSLAVKVCLGSLASSLLLSSSPCLFSLHAKDVNGLLAQLNGLEKK